MEPRFFICSIWSRKSSSVNGVGLHLLGHLRGFLFVEAALRLFDERQHVPPCRGYGSPCGRDENGSMSVSFSPMPENLMALPVTARTESARAAARVAVQLGQYHAGERDGSRERPWHVDRVLAGHGVSRRAGSPRADRVADAPSSSIISPSICSGPPCRR